MSDDAIRRRQMAELAATAKRRRAADEQALGQIVPVNEIAEAARQARAWLDDVLSDVTQKDQTK